MQVTYLRCMSGFRTPHFSLTQDDAFVCVRISVPHVRVSAAKEEGRPPLLGAAHAPVTHPPWAHRFHVDGGATARVREIGQWSLGLAGLPPPKPALREQPTHGPRPEAEQSNQERRCIDRHPLRSDNCSQRVFFFDTNVTPCDRRPVHRGAPWTVASVQSDASLRASAGLCAAAPCCAPARP